MEKKRMMGNCRKHTEPSLKDFPLIAESNLRTKMNDIIEEHAISMTEIGLHPNIYILIK